MTEFSEKIPVELPEKYYRFAENYISRRKNHVLNMLELSTQLLQTYTDLKEIEQQLYIAVLCHDCGKELPRQKQKKLANKYRGQMDNMEKRIPALWHAPAAAALTVQELGLAGTDELVTAISFHPTGKAPLSVLLQGLMIADYAESGREYQGARDIRESIGRLTLIELAGRTVGEKLKHCIETENLIHPWSIEAYNYLCV